MCDLMAAAEGVSDIDDLRKFLLYKSAPPVYRTMVETALQATERENAQRIGPTSD
jgi:CO dehydrogenase/acetyl-CoA synthase beta subunit